MMLEGKTAIVTGGTRGIGFATVQRFLEEGAQVALFGSRKESVDTALKSLPPHFLMRKLSDFHQI
ncbi:MAG: SDR family NAD(P)-dependent oxidoreductase [Raoultibacter sp.]|jgi:NAD(P)-dependent dehydrogenase (short-subunit alcohol dehydrogenase family)